MTIPNKVHIIIDHVEDYIDATGHGLGTTSDQMVEACHSQLNKRLVSSNYWVKDLTSEIHFNSNVIIKDSVPTYKNVLGVPQFSAEHKI